MARTIEESFFLWMPSTGLSSMVSTSLAWTVSTRESVRPRLGARGGDVDFVADEADEIDLRVGGQRPFDAFDDYPATVVATHDIHCDTHK